MTISLIAVIVLVLAVAGIIWCYPRLPAPWNLILVILIALICVVALLNLSGVIHVGVIG